MNNSPEFSSPHIRSGSREYLVALDFLIAALPLVIWSIIAYGARPLIVMLLSALCAALFEVLYALVLKVKASLASCAMLGLILALFMPAGVNYLFVPAAALIAVTLRRFTGGVINPIAGALLPFYFLSKNMSAHTAVFDKPSVSILALTEDRADTLFDTLSKGELPEVTALDALLGNAPDTIGGLSAVLLILAALYLIGRRAIGWQAPLGAIGGALAVFFLLFYEGSQYDDIIYTLCAGSLVLGAVFGSTEYSSSPITPVGRFLHGLGCGALAMFLRTFGLGTEGVLLSMLIMSLLSRPIDMITAERYFGYAGKKIFERLSTLVPTFKK